MQAYASTREQETGMQRYNDSTIQTDTNMHGSADVYATW